MRPHVLNAAPVSDSKVSALRVEIRGLDSRPVGDPRLQVAFPTGQGSALARCTTGILKAIQLPTIRRTIDKLILIGGGFLHDTSKPLISPVLVAKVSSSSPSR